MRVMYRKSLNTKTKPECSRAAKQSLPWHGNITSAEIDVINELLRMHKRKGAADKESWKLLPKDSCEVYRSRQKRNSIKRKTEVTNKRRPVDNPKSVVRFKRAKSENKRRGRKKRQKSRRSRCRRQPPSSSCSRTSSGSCVRGSSARNSSDSEMEYE